MHALAAELTRFLKGHLPARVGQQLLLRRHIPTTQALSTPMPTTPMLITPIGTTPMLTTPIGTMPIEMMPRGATPTAIRLGLSPHWAVGVPGLSGSARSPGRHHAWRRASTDRPSCGRRCS